MNDDGKFWLRFWKIALGALISLVFIISFNYHYSFRQYVKSGYVIKYIPGRGNEWVKDCNYVEETK